MQTTTIVHPLLHVCALSTLSPCKGCAKEWRLKSSAFSLCIPALRPPPHFSQTDSLAVEARAGGPEGLYIDMSIVPNGYVVWDHDIVQPPGDSDLHPKWMSPSEWASLCLAVFSQCVHTSLHRSRHKDAHVRIHPCAQPIHSIGCMIRGSLCRCMYIGTIAGVCTHAYIPESCVRSILESCVPRCVSVYVYSVCIYATYACI